MFNEIIAKIHSHHCLKTIFILREHFTLEAFIIITITIFIIIIITCIQTSSVRLDRTHPRGCLLPCSGAGQRMEQEVSGYQDRRMFVFDALKESVAEATHILHFFKSELKLISASEREHLD